MQCDRQAKTLKFQHKGNIVTLQGLKCPPLQLNNISAKQVYKSSQGNDIWAYVVVDSIAVSHTQTAPTPTIPEDLKHLLDVYADVF